MDKNEKIRNEDLILFWGFLFFVLGTIGLIQIGLLENIFEFILIGLITMMIGIAFLLFLIVRDKSKVKN